MTTRRDFLLGGAAMGVPMIGVSSPIKSMIGARDGSIVVEDDMTTSARDYVQDGLVAMWDGIENAGWGKRNPASTKWIDLIGGHEFTLDNGGSWGDNCLACSVTARAAYGSNMTGPAPTVVEAVLKMNSIAGSWKIIWHQGGWAASNKPLRCLVGTSSYGTVLFGTKGNVSSVLNTNPMSLHVDYDTSGLSALKRNLQDITINANTTSWYVNDGGNAFVIGGRSPTASTYAANFNFYSLRLYSRALTADEVASNYEIDKERFGL